MNADQAAVSIIDSLAEPLHLEWVNPGRTADDWKARIYEQAYTGRQLALYKRKSTLVRLQQPVTGIPGVLDYGSCPTSHALNVKESRFRDGSGVCVTVDNETALRELLTRYFGTPAAAPVPVLPAPEPARIAPDDSRAARLARLATAPRKPQKEVVSRTEFKRNPDVVAEVLYRAQGHCEACGSSAPFRKASDGEPYLEVHHVVPLAEDGDDTVDNAQALCPNCHRKAHFG